VAFAKAVVGLIRAAVDSEAKAVVWVIRTCGDSLAGRLPR
jgi:hypothetical protein